MCDFFNKEALPLTMPLNITFTVMKADCISQNKLFK